MWKILSFVFVIAALVSFILSDSVEAKKSGNKKSLNSQQLEQMTQTVDRFTQKVYSNALFSPQENAELIQIKIKLDDQMLTSQDSQLCPLYYKLANIYRTRELKNEAIECYQLILENFSDTPFALKSRKALIDLGVKVVDSVPSQNEDDNNGSSLSQ